MKKKNDKLSTAESTVTIRNPWGSNMQFNPKRSNIGKGGVMTLTFDEFWKYFDAIPREVVLESVAAHPGVAPQEVAMLAELLREDLELEFCDEVGVHTENDDGRQYVLHHAKSQQHPPKL